MNIEYKNHPYFEGILLVFLDGRLMGDVANDIWHPTGAFEWLTDDKQDAIVKHMINDKKL